MIHTIYPHPAQGVIGDPVLCIFKKNAILGSVPSISSQVLGFAFAFAFALLYYTKRTIVFFFWDLFYYCTFR
jgi:hypothetical protein